MRQLLCSLRSTFADFSLSAATAGFIAVLTGYTSSLALMVQAGRSAGLDEAQIASWIWAISIAMGATAIILTLRYRMPIVVAWSTPGAALLVTSLAGVDYPHAVGAFIVTGVLLTVTGVYRPLASSVRRLPASIAAALLAGILFSLGIQLFQVTEQRPSMVLAMLIVFFAVKRWRPAMAVPAALVAGCVTVWVADTAAWPQVPWQLTRPIWTTPEFSLAALTSIALPLYVVAMASQNLPGLAVLRADGYEPPASPLLTATGVASLLAAPFGSHGVNLAAISAALCTGPGAHPRPEQRYPAALVFGALAIVVGCFAGTLTSVFMALPQALVVSIAGLALLGSIGNGLAQAMADASQREAALVTFMVTASGLTLLSIGSAFWGLLAGLAVLVATRRRKT